MTIITAINNNNNNNNNNNANNINENIIILTILRFTWECKILDKKYRQGHKPLPHDTVPLTK